MSSFLTKDQMMALGVKLIGIAGGALVTKGVMTTDQVSSLQADLPAAVGAIGIVYAVVYSLWANRPWKQAATVAAQDGVKVTVPTQEAADKIIKANPKVADSVVVAQ